MSGRVKIVDLANVQEFWTHALQTWYLQRGDKLEIIECLSRNDSLTDVHALILADIFAGKLRPFGPRGGPRLERRLGVALRDDVIREEYRASIQLAPELTVIEDLAEKHMRSSAAIKKIVNTKIPKGGPTIVLAPMFSARVAEHGGAFGKLEAQYKKRLLKVK